MFAGVIVRSGTSAVDLDKTTVTRIRGVGSNRRTVGYCKESDLMKIATVAVYDENQQEALKSWREKIGFGMHYS